MSYGAAGSHSCGSRSRWGGGIDLGRLMKTSRVPLVISAALLSLAAGTVAATATVAPGSPGKDVTRGLDNDVASNTFIQPPGVAAKQHMEATDVLFGRDNDDLLQGNLGSDTLVAGNGDDIMIGGPEKFATPNSDVLLGDAGNDINIWAPGDGSDAYVGDTGTDTMVFAPFVQNPNGSIKHVWYQGRLVPRVDISKKPAFSCQIVRVPASQRLGAQFLVRFLVNGVPAVTVRQKDVERVFCPSPWPGYLRAATLTDPHPQFRSVRLADVRGPLKAIVAAP